MGLFIATNEAIGRPTYPSLPTDLIRADVTPLGTLLRLTSTGTHFDTPSHMRADSLEDALKQAPMNDGWAVDQIFHHPGDSSCLAQAALHGQCLSISDGSFKNSRDISACLIEGRDKGPHRIVAVNAILGVAESQSAHRSELGGISCILAIIEAICLLHQVCTGSVEIGLDGEQALNNASGSLPSVSSQSSFDLLTDTRTKLAKSSLTCTFAWVEGHQLEKCDTCDHRGSLDDLCDSLAKAFRRRQERLPPPSAQRFEDEGWSLSTHGLKLECVDADRACDATCEEHSRKCWEHRHDIPNVVMDNVNWDLLGNAMKKWPMGKHKWLAKHLS